jgi:hypothetical protein
MRQENAAQLYDILPCERINGQQLLICVRGQVRRQRVGECNATRDSSTQLVQLNYRAPDHKYLAATRLFCYQLLELVQ